MEPDGIVLKTKSGISKVYFVELPNDVQQRFHYNAAIASAYSAQQTVNQTTMAAARRGEPIEVISHGAQVDINQHLALGSVTVIDFYADWCGPCRRLSPSLEQMARSDPEIALRKIDISSIGEPRSQQQFNIHSIPQVNVYDKSGPSRRHRPRRRFRKSQKLRRASKGERLSSCAATRALRTRRRYEFNSEPNIDSKVYIVPSAAKMAMKIDRQIVEPGCNKLYNQD